MSLQILHNPRCSKSRSTLKILEDKNLKPEICEYLKSTPSAKDLSEIIKKLNCSPTAIIRFKENRAKELEISPKDEKSDQDWINLLVENPILIERPIVINGNKAKIGRPPEQILEIL